MASWRLELNIVSASNVPDVREFGRMKVYAIVSINGAQNSAYRTPADHNGETNPRWNTKTPYNVPYKTIQGGNHNLLITLYCERSVLDDKFVCSVQCSLKQLFKDRITNTRNGYREYNVRLWRNNSNTGFGTLKFTYRFFQMVPVLSRAIQPHRNRPVHSHVIDRHGCVLIKGICKALSNLVPGASLLYALIGE